MAGGQNDAGARKFIQIPPESTGDRTYQVHTAEIPYSGKEGFDTTRGTPHDWIIGSMYNIGGAFGMVHVHGYTALTPDSGILSVHYNKQKRYAADNVHPAIGATIASGSDVVATISEQPYSVYIQTTNIMGFDNPEYGLDVDITGSANIRFAEGLPQLDAWGKLRISGGTQLGDYVFGQEDVFTSNFSPVKLDGGYVNYSNTRHSVKVGVDNTVSPSTGFAASSSNQYHHYIAGSSHLWAGSALLNSPQTTGNNRHWGLFDANNGFGFKVGTGGVSAIDDTGFSVFIRSNIPEADQKDTIIPRSQWNGDKLDGTGDSQVAVDLSKINLWWIDVQWHGAGRVRFGVYQEGQRVVCHSYYQGNEYGQAMSQTTSLPCCYSTSTTAGSTTDLYIETWSAAVWTESDIDLRASGSPATYASPHIAVTADIADNWQRLFALSPTELHANGEVNHTLYVPTSINAYAFNDTGQTTNAFDGADSIIDLKMEINSIDNDNVFSGVPSTNVQIGTAGTSYQGGKVILQDMFKGRYDNVLTDTFNNLQYGAVKNLPDDGGTVENTIAVISNATPAVATVTGRLMPRVPMSNTLSINPGTYKITGTDNANYDDKQVYVRPIGLNICELYEDAALTIPVDGSVEGSATGGNIKGFQGARVIWSFFAKTRTTYYPNTKIMVIVNWKEIVQ